MIVLDAVLGKVTKSWRLPPLAVGLGIYLPTSTTLMVVVGAIVGSWFNHRAERHAPKAAATKQLGVLLASGLIVGESLLGVVFAALVAFSGKSAPIGLVGEGFATPAIAIGGIAFVAVVTVMYRWIERLGQA